MFDKTNGKSGKSERFFERPFKSNDAPGEFVQYRERHALAMDARRQHAYHAPPLHP
ncbi:hypothetical protein [Pseudomonas mangiferae]|uniref:hypothetical protein n=1 Tax=Pseudomonas mangiferae TaxID=2593654 RepID=UPI0015B40E2C|nr:hypothetical protein [Pseudomonas mangiferae]